MADYLWSNPVPSNQTNAALSAGYKVDAPAIGAIVAAILGNRMRQQELDNEKQQQQQKAIGGVFQAYGQQQQQGQADDAANAALYGQMNPTDPYGGYTDSNRVPDYGGTNALKAYSTQSDLQTEALKREMEQERIKAIEAKLNAPSTVGGGSSASGMPNIVHTPSGDFFQGPRGWHRIPGATQTFDPNAIKPTAADKYRAGVANAPTYPAQTVYTDEASSPEAAPQEAQSAPGPDENYPVGTRARAGDKWYSQNG